MKVLGVVVDRIPLIFEQKKTTKMSLFEPNVTFCRDVTTRKEEEKEGEIQIRGEPPRRRRIWPSLS